MQRVKKRFTDTLKWEKEWFLSLECGDKLVWLYLLDNCDEAGLWNVNWRLCSILTGVELKGCPSVLKHQLIQTNHDKVMYIKDFMEFQYPDYMYKKSPMIAKCVKRLIKYGIVKQDDYSKAQQSVNHSDSTLNASVQEEEEEKEKVEEIVKEVIVKNKIDVSLRSIDNKFLTDLQSKHMDVDVEEEFTKFKDYLASKGKTYKNYQAAFRNWIKSNYVPKSDKLRNENILKKQQIKERERLAKLKEQEERGEIGGPPPEFFDEMKKLTRKFKSPTKE